MPKLALKSIRPVQCYLLETIGVLTIALITGLVIMFRSPEIISGLHFNLWAWLMGICWGIATLAFIVALSFGKLSILAPLTALYPAITVILALLILKESISLVQGIGIIFALIAGVLLAI